jgi:tyrosinase
VFLAVGQGLFNGEVIMGIRKDQSTLTPGEKARFVKAVLRLKDNGIYDRYVRQHRDYFNTLIHRTALFLPWHREFLRRFELDLQGVDPGVTLPYWDWTIDNSRFSSPWRVDFMGGNGVPPSGPVPDGPFAFETGNWTLTVGDPMAQLTRALGFGGALASWSTVQSILGQIPYRSFSTDLEDQVHNGVHGWIGGSAARRSSPNDPAFFLLHCNVDRLWADWQRLHPNEARYQGVGPGLGLNDPMLPWANEFTPPTPASVLVHSVLGYSYDRETVQPEVVELAVNAPALPAVITDAGERDWYRFVVPATGSYLIETEGDTDTFLTLYGPDSQTAFIAANDDKVGSDGGRDLSSRIVRELAPAEYFAQVRHFSSGGTGPYGIRVRSVA